MSGIFVMEPPTLSSLEPVSLDMKPKAPLAMLLGHTHLIMRTFPFSNAVACRVHLVLITYSPAGESDTTSQYHPNNIDF